MLRVFAVFAFSAFVGLLINATLVHSSFPGSVAPDFILILSVAISFFYHTPIGVCGAFLLGIAADFASGLYIGPNAAGCVVAFCLVGMIANRVYADKIVAVFIITSICSVAKSFTYLLLVFFYVPDRVLPDDLLKLILLEAIFSGIMAPLVLRAIRGNALSMSVPRMQGTPSLRYSS